LRDGQAADAGEFPQERFAQHPTLQTAPLAQSQANKRQQMEILRHTRTEIVFTSGREQAKIRLLGQ